MKVSFKILFAVFFLASMGAQATFKAGQVYRLKKALTLTKKASPTLVSPQGAASVEKSVLTGPGPAVAYWSLEKKEFAKTDRLSPGVCELRSEARSAVDGKLSFPKKSTFKVSSPIRAEDATVQDPRALSLKNCLVMDAISEKGPPSLRPQIHIQCCSDKDLPTPASHQEFNEQIQESFKSILKLISEE
jgi:hypothetical protein